MTRVLISKISNILYSDYKGKTVRLSKEIPYSVDEVVVRVGAKNNKRKVTTFRNEKGEIIERCFDYPNQRYRNILYTRLKNALNDNEQVVSTIKKEYSSSRDSIYDCDLMKIEVDHLATIKSEDEKILSRTSVVNMDTIGKSIHRFIEFPHVVANKVKKNLSKILYFEVNQSTGKIIRDTLFADGIKYSQNDKFLQFRAYDIDGMKEPITYKFLKDKKVNNLNVVVYTDYVPKSDLDKKRLSACFNPNLGVIKYNEMYRHKSKSAVVNSARHEVEHVWHYYLDARNSGETTGWQGEVYQRFGPIRDKKLKHEADKCSDAIANYVSYDEDYEAYRSNYIEDSAYTIAEKFGEKYVRQGEKLRRSLPHIPEHLL